MDSGNALGVVVITGASTGIGKACALHLDQLGFTVFAGVRKAEDHGRLRHGASSKLRTIDLDIRNEVHIASAVTAVSRELEGRPLVGLVNNAAVGFSGPLESVCRGTFLDLLDVNVVSHLSVTNALLPFLKRDRARIVNVGSTSGRIPEPLSGPYCASKFALEAISATLRAELRPDQVEVSIIEPGAISTPLWHKMIQSQDEWIEALPEKAGKLYGERLTRRRAELLQLSESARSPEGVCRAVTHALTSKRPKYRYTVGFDAKLRTAVARVLPESLRSSLVALKRRATSP